MILGQFLPGSIKNKKVLNAFSEIPRENFLPKQFSSVAYSDLNIKVNDLRYIPSPFNTARIFQEANFEGNEVVLLIGGNYGYEASVLSKIVDTTVTIEEDKKMYDLALTNVKKSNIQNLVIVNGKHQKGHKKLGPYDAIVSLDSNFYVHNIIIDQLVEGGRLYFSEKQSSSHKESKLNVLYKIKKGYNKISLFDINIPSNVILDKENSHFELN